MSQHCRANPCCGDRPCSGVPLPQHASGLPAHNKNIRATQPAPAEHVVGVELVEKAFEIGFAWRSQLILQNVEDSRAVGRTLQSYLFDDMPIDTTGFNSFDTGDAGIVEGKKRILAALRRAALATATEGSGE